MTIVTPEMYSSPVTTGLAVPPGAGNVWFSVGIS
jgi:hypothetical protein